MATRKDVFLIREGKDKNYWSRAGVAFVNRDNSLNVKLDLFPGVQFQIRDPRPADKNKKGGRQ